MKEDPRFEVPASILTSPAKNISVKLIDFSKTTLPEYKDHYAVVIDNALTPEECTALINAAEAGAPKGWERAMVNIGYGRQALFEDQRNCGRIIWDSQDLADRIWERLEKVPELQEILRLKNRPLITGKTPAMGGDVWTFARPNERLRFLKYVGGEYFRSHCDGVYETPDGKERSWFTMHLYLNGGDHDDSNNDDSQSAAYPTLVGGATKFHPRFHEEADEKDLSIHPKAGRVLIFQHRGLLHSGADVIQGVKYTLRTDLMYGLESTNRRRPSQPWIGLSRGK